MGVPNDIFVNDQPPACEDKHLNAYTQEINNAIASAGINVSESDKSQLAMALAVVSSASHSYTASGSANSILLSSVAGIAGPKSYVDGMECNFTATTPNTGQVTVNVNNLGEKTIKNVAYQQLSGGEISGFVTLIFKKAQDCFFVVPYMTRQRFNVDFPAGIPLPWPGSTPPPGWLECNGQSFNTSTYPELAKAYPSGVIIDLRGEFIRGWDHGRGVDNGRTIASRQNDEFKAHTHDVQTYGTDTANNGNFIDSGDESGKAGICRDAALEVGGSETRPRNVAFMYIVRAA